MIYILTGTFGTDLWKFDIFGGLPSGTMFEFMLYAGSLASSLPMSFYNIYCSYRDGTGKMLGPMEAIRPLWNPVVLFSLCTIWMIYSPTDIMDRDPRMFLYLIGVLFANINVSLSN